MELFERVRMIAQGEKKQGESLADQIEVNQNTFNGWLSQKRQDNLWPHLEKILAIHPEISRKWLYFGEGRFLLADDPDNEELQNTLNELSRTRQRVIDLEGQIEALKGQIEALKGQTEALNKVIALQTQPLIGESPFTTERGVALPRSVAHSSTEEIEKKKVQPPPRP